MAAPTITGVNPDPVPPNGKVTITFGPGTAANVTVTDSNGTVVVAWVNNGPGSVTVGPFPAAGDYQITITNNTGGSCSTGITAQ